MKRRLPSRQFFGWQFVVGLLVFIAMTLVLAEISDQVMEGKPLTLSDAQLTSWVQLHRTPAQIVFFKCITLLGSTIAGVTLATVAGIVLLVRKQRYRFTALVLS